MASAGLYRSNRSNMIAGVIGGGKDAREAGDLLEAQQRLPRQEAVVVVEHRLGHAVHAAEVAAVGDRDAQILHRTAAAVQQLAGGGRQVGGDLGLLAEQAPFRVVTVWTWSRAQMGVITMASAQPVPTHKCFILRICNLQDRCSGLTRVETRPQS